MEITLTIDLPTARLIVAAMLSRSRLVGRCCGDFSRCERLIRVLTDTIQQAEEQQAWQDTPTKVAGQESKSTHA